MISRRIALPMLVDYQGCYQAIHKGTHVQPLHPGLTLKNDVLPAPGLTVTQAAQQLEVSRDAVASAQWADWHLAGDSALHQGLAGFEACR